MLAHIGALRQTQSAWRRNSQASPVKARGFAIRCCCGTGYGYICCGLLPSIRRLSRFHKTDIFYYSHNPQRMPLFDLLYIRPPSGPSIGGKLTRGVESHFMQRAREAGCAAGKDPGSQAGEPQSCFHSVLIDFAAEHAGACRTHKVRTARHAAAPGPNRSLALKRRQFPYNPFGAA